MNSTTTTRATIPNTFTPARGACGRSTGVGKGRRISHDREFTRQFVYCQFLMYCLGSARIVRAMPKLWNQTIETHRQEVREAILDAAAALVTEHGLRSATMSQIAERTGIGRATLYKYFPDIEAILLAWHERQIIGHLKYLADVRDRAGDARGKLEAVLEAYALISHASHGHHDTELAAFLHRDAQVARAHGGSS